MVEEKKIPNGYKMSEVGIIPDDWKCTTIKELINDNIIEKPLDGNHGNIHPKSSDYVLTGIPFIMANNIVGGKICFKSCKFISKQQADNLRKGFSHEGDVLLTHKGTIGNTAIVPKINTNYIMLTPQVTYYRVKDNEKICNKYIKAYFDSVMFQKQLKELSGGGTREYIGIVKQQALNFLMPNLQEQKKIATVISDTDDLILSLEKLINKKKLIKQGTMQELLSGKKRIDGFSGEWSKVRVDEMGEIITGSTPSTNNKYYWNGEIPWITPSDISDNKDVNTSERKISDKAISTVRMLPANTLLVTCIASIGKNCILRVEGACNQQINAIIPFNKFDTDYLYYLMQYNKKYLLSNSGITATNIISKNTFSQLEFILPDYDEQKAISSILSDMDKEIEALQKKLDKYKKIKEGMMEELLTGKRRLV